MSLSRSGTEHEQSACLESLKGAIPISMVRRTRLQSKTDDLAYPIRVKFRVPQNGLGAIVDRLTIWLRDELGRNRYARHSASVISGQGMALHFRTLEDAQRCVDAFPELEIADGVALSIYYSP